MSLELVAACWEGLMNVNGTDEIPKRVGQGHRLC
jgi:hypothetical protein